MLLLEGISKGVEPTVQVLEINTNSTRQPSDLLPYLPGFAEFFDPLPHKESNMVLKPVFIPLSDVECVTRTLLKAPQPLEILIKRSGNTLTQACVLQIY